MRLQIGSIPQWYVSPFQYNSRSIVVSAASIRESVRV